MFCEKCGFNIHDLSEPCSKCGEMNYCPSEVGVLKIKEKNGKFGFIDSDTNSIMVEPIFDKVEKIEKESSFNIYNAYRGGMLFQIPDHYMRSTVLFQDDKNMQRYILRNGLVVDMPVRFLNGYDSYCFNDLFGIINDKYQIITVPMFLSATPSSVLDYAIAFTCDTKNSLGIADEIVFIKTLDHINTRIIELKDLFSAYPKYYWYFDNSLCKIVALDFNKNDTLVEGVRRYFEGEKYGLIKPNGEIVLRPTYDDIGSFNENYAIARLGGARGIINKNGQIVVNVKYDSIDEKGSYEYSAWIGKEEYNINLKTNSKAEIKHIKSWKEYGHSYGAGGSRYYDDRNGHSYGAGGSRYYDDRYGHSYGAGGSRYYDDRYGHSYGAGGSRYYDDRYGHSYGAGGSTYYDSRYGHTYKDK